MGKTYYMLRKKSEESPFGFQGFFHQNFDVQSKIESMSDALDDIIEENIDLDLIDELMYPAPAHLNPEEEIAFKVQERKRVAEIFKRKIVESEEYQTQLAQKIKFEQENLPFLFFSYNEEGDENADADHSEDFFSSLTEAYKQREQVFQYYEDHNIDYDPTDYYFAKKDLNNGSLDIVDLTAAEAESILKAEKRKMEEFLAQQRRRDNPERSPKVGASRVIKRI